MAQGTQEHRQPVHAEPSEPTNPFGITAEAWAAAAQRRNFRVHDGMPVVEKEGAVAKLLAPTSLDEIFHAVAEYRRNRIGGSLNGVSLQAALDKAASGEGLPSPKSNDAFDSVYADKIAELVDAAKGWTPEVVSKMTKEQRMERTKVIDSSAFTGDKAALNRQKYYNAAVQEALTAGMTAGAKRESKRAPASKKESIEL
jgi:hypothetical protein